MMNPAHEDAIDWEATTWDGSRRRQIEDWARLSLDEIFDAQEEMGDLVHELAGYRLPFTSRSDVKGKGAD